MVKLNNIRYPSETIISSLEKDRLFLYYTFFYNKENSSIQALENHCVIPYIYNHKIMVVIRITILEDTV